MNLRDLERLEANPHYALTEKQAAELARLRSQNVQHATRVPRHDMAVPKHPVAMPKENEGDGDRSN